METDLRYRALKELNKANNYTLKNKHVAVKLSGISSTTKHCHKRSRLKNKFQQMTQPISRHS